MKVLVWHWGRRGAGPRFAAELAATLRDLPGHDGALSLSAQAELLRGPAPPPCELPFSTYSGLGGLLLRLPGAPFLVGPLAARIRALAPGVAVCAMPAPLDLVMAAALRRAGVPFLVVVHDADAHPGDGFPLQMLLQRRLVRRADGLIALTEHVAARLRAQGLADGKPMIVAALPPFAFGPPAAAAARAWRQAPAALVRPAAALQGTRPAGRRARAARRAAGSGSPGGRQRSGLRSARRAAASARRAGGKPLGAGA